MSTQTPNRVSKGVPTGGQFAENLRGENDITPDLGGFYSTFVSDEQPQVAPTAFGEADISPADDGGLFAAEGAWNDSTVMPEVKARQASDVDYARLCGTRGLKIRDTGMSLYDKKPTRKTLNTAFIQAIADDDLAANPPKGKLSASRLGELGKRAADSYERLSLTEQDRDRTAKLASKRRLSEADTDYLADLRFDREWDYTEADDYAGPNYTDSDRQAMAQFFRDDWNPDNPEHAHRRLEVELAIERKDFEAESLRRFSQTLPHT